MKILIVYAHHEPKSFSSALLQRSIATLGTHGHEVQVSDLYAMNFNPLATASDFTDRRFPEALQYDREQKNAYKNGTLASDLMAEIDKLLWCDFLILQFPLWWYSVPAIMKGWIDRVLANSVAYGQGQRFETGGLKGRRAMLVTTTACYENMVAPDGLLGDLNVILWHLNCGTLAYTGMEVLPPFCAWSIHYTTPESRSQYLDEYAERLRTLETTPPLFFHPVSDFGPDWKLKPELEPKTVGQHRPNLAVLK